MSGPEEGGLSPDEARVAALLRQVAGAPVAAPSTALVRRVVRTARWQRVVRGALLAAGHVVGALGEGLALLVRGRRER